MESAELTPPFARDFAESLTERGYLRAPRAADLAPGHFRARRLHPGRVIIEWRERGSSPRRIEPEKAREELPAKRIPTPRPPRIARGDWKLDFPVGSRVRFVDGPNAGLFGTVWMVPGPPSSRSVNKFGYRVRIDGWAQGRALACAEWLEEIPLAVG